MQEVATPIDVEARRGQMFPALTPTQLARVSAAGVETTFEDGQIVFERGDRETPFYVVVEGELEIVHPRLDLEVPITIHGAGQFTGEASTLADRPTLVRARARGRVRLIRVEHARFRSLLQTDSDLSEIVMRAYILRRLGLLSGGVSDAIVLGSRHSAATLRLQEFLVRNGHPYRYLDVEREAEIEQLLGHVRVEVADIPLLIHDCTILRNPSDAEVADCLGMNAALDPCAVHDLVVCGAGPGGLAAAVYAASEGLDVLIVDARAPGGQAASSSKIENYLGFPTGVSGLALVGRALAQAEKFGAKLAVARGAVKLHCNDAGLVRIDLAGGNSVHARAVVIATGAEYRKLDVPDLARFEGVGVYYAATFMEAQQCAEDEIVVIGGGNSAGQAATFLAQSCRRVHVLIRSGSLAASMSRYLIRRIEETSNITLRTRTHLTALRGDGHLENVTWRDGTGEETTLPIRHVFSMAGASPNTAWLRDCVRMDDKGFVMTDAELTDAILTEERWPLARRPHLFETSRPRVFAIGDVRSNNVKRVASAVGEGSVCIQLVHKALLE